MVELTTYSTLISNERGRARKRFFVRDIFPLLCTVLSLHYKTVNVIHRLVILCSMCVFYARIGCVIKHRTSMMQGDMMRASLEMAYYDVRKYRGMIERWRYKMC
ncbi:hypothetical protein C8R48DRAFT_728995 [Suillus tomentosus]|nr:hypothetical protein C8R48DRAFT_728995 [Suillus tomentosus]